MNFLALDTSSVACSVAISKGDEIFSSHKVNAESHSLTLIPTIQETLKTAKIKLNDLDAIILGIGPGSFVGTRIGAAVAQGIAFGVDIEIVTVSSMETVALEAMINVEGGLPVNVMALLEGDEILGSPSFRGMFEKYFKQLSTADVSFSPGASQNAKGVSSMNLGSKGMIYAELIASGAAWGRGPQGGPLHGMTKSVVDSPVWRLVHALSSLTESDGNTVAVKGFYDDLMPPTDEERKAAAAYALRTGGQGWNHILNGLTGVKAPAGDLNDEDTILNFFYGPSFNINGMRSGFIGPGTLPFSLPHEASARFDIRVPRGYKVDKTINLIRDHLSSNGYGDLEFRVMGAYDSSYTGTDTELVQSICRAFELMEVPLLIAPYSGGGGPWSLYTTELGIPMIRSVGVGGGGNAPGLGEFMVIDGTDKMGGLVECELSHVHMLKSYAEGV